MEKNWIRYQSVVGSMTWIERSICCKRPVIVEYVDAPDNYSGNVKMRILTCKGCHKHCESINL